MCVRNSWKCCYNADSDAGYLGLGDTAFLTSSQEMPALPIRGPHFERQDLNKNLRYILHVKPVHYKSAVVVQIADYRTD